MAMTKNCHTRCEREEIEKLLPWYVMGRLDHDDVAAVEAHLSRDPDLERQFRHIRDEYEQSVRGNEAIAARPLRNVDRLMAGVERLPAPAAPARHTLWARLAGLFTLPSAGAERCAGADRWGGGLRWAGAVAALLIVAQAGLLVPMVVTQHPTYVPASGGPAAVASDTTALVRFVDGATTSAVAEMLAAENMAIVSGPQAGMFTVRIGPKTMSEADRSARIEILRSRRDLVAAVLLMR